MSIALAATFNPRGEIGRLKRLYPQLQAVYAHFVISMPPAAHAEDIAAVGALPGVRTHVNGEWSHGRHMAVKLALDAGADFIHYADMDRLLRWVETRHDEWQWTVQSVADADHVIMGRTKQAYQSHPKALIETEKISNAFVSHCLGQTIDASAGSKGFSRRAAQCLMANAKPGRALGADGEWAILLHRAGFGLCYVEADGLDWETADRYLDRAADGERQRQLAEEYDSNAKNWDARVQVALEIVQGGIDAMQRPLIESQDENH
jgi:hypothetical protein